jgi:hypothetical protein
VRRTTCFIAAKFRAFRRALRCFRPEPIPSNVLLSLAPVSLSVKRAPANIGQQGAADHKACYRKSRQQAGPKADPAEGEEQGAPSWPMRVIPALSGNSAHTATATRNPATQTMEILNPRWKRLIHDRFAPAMGAVWRGEHGLLRGLLNFTEGEHNGTIFEEHADVAQLVEQLIRNQQVVSSSLTVGSICLSACLIARSVPRADTCRSEFCPDFSGLDRFLLSYPQCAAPTPREPSEVPDIHVFFCYAVASRPPAPAYSWHNRIKSGFSVKVPGAGAQGPRAKPEPTGQCSAGAPWGAQEE